MSSDVLAAYNMMLETVTECLDKSNYFTIEFKQKLVDYEFKISDVDEKKKKMSWKGFFADTYAEE
jgi:GTP-sensing pleiotropic transcriptional regulator CodY